MKCKQSHVVINGKRVYLIRISVNYILWRLMIDVIDFFTAMFMILLRKIWSELSFVIVSFRYRRGV